MKRVGILTLFVCLLVLVSGGVYAESIALSDASLEFVGDPGDKICQSLVIYSSNPANVVGEDRWSLKDSRNLLDYDHNSNFFRVSIEYPKLIDFNKKEDINVCITGLDEGTYFGVLMYKNGNVAAGTWLKVIIGNGVNTNFLSEASNSNTLSGSVVLEPKNTNQTSSSVNPIVIFSIISLILVIVFVVLIVVYSSKKKKSMVV